MGERLAKERGWPFARRLVEAEGIEHDHEKMFALCETALFGTTPGTVAEKR